MSRNSSVSIKVKKQMKTLLRPLSRAHGALVIPVLSHLLAGLSKGARGFCFICRTCGIDKEEETMK